MKKFLLIASMIFISSTLFAERITFHADRMTGSTKKNSSDATVLTGNASIVTENMELSADTIEISGKNFRYIKASGNITGKIKDSQMDFTCQNMSYDREKKVAVLQNTVHLVDSKNKVTADAEIIDYSQTTEIAVLQINVVMVQGNNTCTAAHAIYRKNEQTLTMSGNPTVQQGTDKFRAQEIQLNLKTNEIKLDGRVRGSVTADSTKQQSEPASNAETENGSPASEKTDEKSSGQIPTDTPTAAVFESTGKNNEQAGKEQ